MGVCHSVVVKTNALSDKIYYFTGPYWFYNAGFLLPMTPDDIVVNSFDCIQYLYAIMPYALSALAAFIASVLRSDKKGIPAKIVEGLGCSSLSTGVVGLLHHYGIAEAGTAVFIGTAIGFFGTDFLMHTFRRLILSKVEVLTKKADDDEHRQGF